MEILDIVKLFAVPLVMFFVGRLSKQSQDVGDHGVRLAVAFEKIEALSSRLAIVERDQASQWKAIDRAKERHGI